MTKNIMNEISLIYWKIEQSDELRTRKFPYLFVPS